MKVLFYERGMYYIGGNFLTFTNQKMKNTINSETSTKEEQQNIVISGQTPEESTVGLLEVQTTKDRITKETDINALKEKLNWEHFQRLVDKFREGTRIYRELQEKGDEEAIKEKREELIKKEKELIKENNLKFDIYGVSQIRKDFSRMIRSEDEENCYDFYLEFFKPNYSLEKVIMSFEYLALVDGFLSRRNVATKNMSQARSWEFERKAKLFDKLSILEKRYQKEKNIENN